MGKGEKKRDWKKEAGEKKGWGRGDGKEREKRQSGRGEMGPEEGDGRRVLPEEGMERGLNVGGQGGMAKEKRGNRRVERES
jgi:hypothetical protein